MSTSKGSGAVVPASYRKMVQSLKEVVNLSDAEIYATLKDCNMNPDEAVSRLLSQDPFHEVKSKREKKKEGKDTTESRLCGANNSIGRGGKGGADRYLGRGGSTPYYSSDSAPTYAKSSYKKENGAASYSSALPLAPGLSGNNRSRGTAGFSEDTSALNKGSSWATSWSTTDGVPLGVQPTLPSHSTWVSTPGQVSMADIVKMGRPQNRALNDPNGSHYNVQDPSTTLHDIARSLDDHVSKDEWPSIEKPLPSIVKPFPESTADTHVHPAESYAPFDGENEDSESEEDVDYDNESSTLNDTVSQSISSRKFPDDDSRGGPQSENSLYGNMGSYVPQPHDFDQQEVDERAASVASVTRHLEQLNVEKDEKEFLSKGDAPSVIIPDHLQVQSADCSHLSFGSFGSSMRIPHLSVSASSLPIESAPEEAHAEGVDHVDPRDFEYYGNDSFRNAPDSNLYQRAVPSSDRYDARTGPSSDRYDVSSATQHERLKPESPEVRYPFPSSFNNEQLLSAAFSRANAEAQNRPPFSSVTQSYASTLPSTLLSANVRPSREPEHEYSAFAPKSPVPTKWCDRPLGPPMTQGENMSPIQSAPHNLSGASVAAGGQPLPQQLSLNQYSQSPHPLGPYASMVGGYPFLHQQNYYVPSAFQQTLATNSPYHQSLGSVHPQYKIPSASNVHQAAMTGNFHLNGNFPLNHQPATPAPSGASLSYDDVLSSQFKDASHLISLQQRENSSVWPQGPNSRTAVPSGTYFNYQGQAQRQPSEYGQSRQATSNYGTLGYPNFYHSQAQDQPQNTRSVSQVQPKQSQNWQDMY